MIFFRLPRKSLLRDEIIATIKNHRIHATRYLDIGCGNGTFTIRN